MTTKKITNDSKTTKTEMYTAYQAAIAQVKELKSRKLDPVAKKNSKRKQETASKVSGLSVDSIQKSIETLSGRTESYLSQLRGEYESELGTLSEIQQAINDKRAELKEIFEIEAEAESLAALVEAQDQKAAAFDEALAGTRAKFDEQIAAERKSWTVEKEEYERNWNLKVAREKEERERQIADAQYNFDREQKEKFDALNDEMAQKAKDFAALQESNQKKLQAEREAFFKERKEYTELETEFTTLKARVEAFETEKATACEAAAESAKTKAKQSFGIESSAIKRGFEADVKVLNGQIEALTRENDRYAEQITSLEGKLESAYERMQDTAKAALNAQGSANTVAQIQEAVSASSSRK